MFIGGYFWELSGRKLQPTIKKSQPPTGAKRRHQQPAPTPATALEPKKPSPFVIPRAGDLIRLFQGQKIKAYFSMAGLPSSDQVEVHFERERLAAQCQILCV